MLLIALAVVSTLGTQPPTTTPPCPSAATTIALDTCLGGERDQAMAQLERYRAAARALLGKDNASAGVLKGFDAAQATWRAYQTTQCGAVYTYWQAGTIRGAMALTCQIRMARLRTHELWSTWLTYPDSTPPLLPEPIVATGS